MTKRENALILCDLVDLAVVAFHGIGRINKLPDGLGILEELAQSVPVVTPLLNDSMVQLAPLLLQILVYITIKLLCFSNHFLSGIYNEGNTICFPS